MSSGRLLRLPGSFLDPIWGRFYNVPDSQLLTSKERCPGKRSYSLSRSIYWKKSGYLPPGSRVGKMGAFHYALLGSVPEPVSPEIHNCALARSPRQRRCNTREGEIRYWPRV